MPDREKIIKDWESILSRDPLDIPWDLIDDTLTLLKEQEAVKPILKREGRNKYYSYYVCPRCDDEVVYDQNYCSECGARFLWEGR